MDTMKTRRLCALIPTLATAVCAMLLTGTSAGAQQHDDGRSQRWPGSETHSQYLVTVTVFETWPAHPKLNFDVGQRRADARPVKPRGPRDHRMSAREYENWLAAASPDDVKIIASPRLLVESGQPATIRVGTNDGHGQPVDGCEVDINVKQSKRHLVVLEMSYHEYGLDVRPPASDFEDGDQIHIRDLRTQLSVGTTQFALATGYIGAPMRLVAVTIDPVESNAADAFPRVEYYAVAWEFGDEKPELADVLPKEHRVLPAEHGQRQDIRRFPDVWLLPEGDTDRALTRWLREHGGGTSIGGKAGAVVGDDTHHAKLEAPSGAYNMQDVPPYEIWFDSTIVGEGDARHTQTSLLVTNTDPAIDEADRETWRTDPLRFTPNTLAVVVIPKTSQNPWRVLIARARCIDSWDDIPQQKAVGVVEEGDEQQLPIQLPPVKPPKDDDTSKTRRH